MAKVSNKEEQATVPEVKFPTEALIRSKSFKDYHPDFLRALLPNAVYTRSQAEAIVNKYFKGGNN